MLCCNQNFCSLWDLSTLPHPASLSTYMATCAGNFCPEKYLSHLQVIIRPHIDIFHSLQKLLIPPKKARFKEGWWFPEATQLVTDGADTDTEAQIFCRDLPIDSGPSQNRLSLSPLEGGMLCPKAFVSSWKETIRKEKPLLPQEAELDSSLLIQLLRSPPRAGVWGNLTLILDYVF
jgi:hypothetical protein